MKRRLPSLLAVRNFESVGRNQSFTLAASELNVTQAAVSHQVRLLEEELGVKLFERFHQRIELTPAGAELLDVATECLDRLADTFDSLSGRKRADRIHVSVTPLISARWLMPRLGEFIASFETAEIIFHHSLQPPNERESKFDVKIFFSTTPLRNPGYDFLFSTALAPVCIPSLLAGIEHLPRDQLLAKLSIVHEFNTDWWREWCRRSGIDEKGIERGFTLDDPYVLENAALLGRGVILGSTHFIRERLELGELVLPFGTDNAIEIFYYMYSPRLQHRRGVDAFRRWILKLADAERAAAPPAPTAPG